MNREVFVGVMTPSAVPVVQAVLKDDFRSVAANAFREVFEPLKIGLPKLAVFFDSSVCVYDSVQARRLASSGPGDVLGRLLRILSNIAACGSPPKLYLKISGTLSHCDTHQMLDALSRSASAKGLILDVEEGICVEDGFLAVLSHVDPWQCQSAVKHRHLKRESEAS